MRTRKRTLTAPPGSWTSQCIGSDTFTDDPSLPRDRWKECSRSRVEYREAKPFAYSATNSTGSFTSGVTGGAFESFTLYDVSGHYYQNIPDVDISLAPFDLQEIRMSRSRSSANLATCIAEFKDTLSMFSNPYLFVKKLAKHPKVSLCRKTPLGELDAVVKSGGDAWLSMTYGVLPFIGDLTELSRVARNPRLALSRAKLKPTVQDFHQSLTRTVKSVPFSPEYMNQAYVSTTRTIERSKMIRCEFRLNPDFQSMSLANQLASYLSLNDYGRLAWELIPYSFVADWFTNLGKRVSNISALNGPIMWDVCSYSSMSKIVTTDLMTSRIGSLNRSGYWRMSMKQPGMLTRKSVVFNRSPHGRGDNSSDPPSFSGSGLTAYKSVSGFALLHGAAGKFQKWLHGK